MSTYNVKIKYRTDDGHNYTFAARTAAKSPFAAIEDVYKIYTFKGTIYQVKATEI